MRYLSHKIFLICFEKYIAGYNEILDLPLNPQTILYGFRHIRRVSSSALILDQLSLLHQDEGDTPILGDLVCFWSRPFPRIPVGDSVSKHLLLMTAYFV